MNIHVPGQEQLEQLPDDLSCELCGKPLDKEYPEFGILDDGRTVRCYECFFGAITSAVGKALKRQRRRDNT